MFELCLKSGSPGKAPIKFTSSEKVKLTLQQHRLENKQLHSQIDKMKSALENHDLISIFSGTDQQKIPPFMKLFWEEQFNLIYHQISPYNYKVLSQSAYNDLRYDSNTGPGVLILPSSRTLRDYKKLIQMS